MVPGRRFSRRRRFPCARAGSSVDRRKARCRRAGRVSPARRRRPMPARYRMREKPSATSRIVIALFLLCLFAPRGSLRPGRILDRAVSPRRGAALQGALRPDPSRHARHLPGSRRFAGPTHGRRPHGGGNGAGTAAAARAVDESVGPASRLSEHARFRLRLPARRGSPPALPLRRGDRRGGDHAGQRGCRCCRRSADVWTGPGTTRAASS